MLGSGRGKSVITKCCAVCLQSTHSVNKWSATNTLSLLLAFIHLCVMWQATYRFMLFSDKTINKRTFPKRNAVRLLCIRVQGVRLMWVDPDHGVSDVFNVCRVESHHSIHPSLDKNVTLQWLRSCLLQKLWQAFKTCTLSCDVSLMYHRILVAVSHHDCKMVVLCSWNIVGNRKRLHRQVKLHIWCQAGSSSTPHDFGSRANLET